MAASREIRSRHPALLLVCRKCCKRSDHGKAMRRELERGLDDDARVVLTGCLDVCPKRAVCAVVSGAGADRYLVLDPTAKPKKLVEDVRRMLRVRS